MIPKKWHCNLATSQRVHSLQDMVIGKLKENVLIFDYIQFIDNFF